MWGDVTRLEVKSVIRTIGIVISQLVYYNIEFLYVSTFIHVLNDELMSSKVVYRAIALPFVPLPPALQVMCMAKLFRVQYVSKSVQCTYMQTYCLHRWGHYL